ncbi:MAG: D-alanyl-D-alanine carboxypeptidase [Salinibacterium sp.]|nr:D-alanyl-D-alanine carboxypeptidase [Salinibacterium sp.]
MFSRRAARESSQKPAARGGIRALIAKHPTAWLASTIAVVFLLLSTGAVFAGIASGSNRVVEVAVPTESAAPPRPQPSAIPAGTHLRTCSIASAAAQPLLGTLVGSVLNANTGEVLFDRSGATPATPANVEHLLTAATVIKILGSAAQLSTRVIDGTSEGTIVLVGGGDPTLATTSNSVYEGAPLISDLATSAMAAYTLKHPGKPVTNIVLDSSLWSATDNWDASWPTSDRSNGYLSYVTALMVDGDRLDPADPEGARSEDPIQRAGDAFAAAAGLSGVTFSRGTAVGSTVLAEVKSQPLSTLLGQMLSVGDNTLAEMLARVASKAAGFDGSSASLAQVIPLTLKDLGLDTSGLITKDASGESPNNSVSPQLVAQLLVKVRANEADLGIIYAGLPVAGQSGDLYNRFSGANAVAVGKIVAKPGWISNERSLAGVINAADGTPLAFAFYGLGDAITRDTKEALDTLATAAFTCGDNLSNN